MFDFLSTTSQKPSESVTMVLDKGLGLAALDDFLAVAGPYVQVIKFGWGTSAALDEALLRAKIERIRAADVLVCPGGTFCEIAYVKGCFEQYLDDAEALGFSCIEVSDGALPMPLDAKLGLIRQAKQRGFTVFSEVGKKTAEDDIRLSVARRVEMVRAELEAGSSKVILEARESGSLGIFDAAGKVKESFVDEIVKEVEIDDLIFEAPQKSQQVWLLRRFGPQVHLGNIPPDEALSVETLRRGLRADTTRDFLLDGIDVHLELGVPGAVRAAERGDIVVVVDALRGCSTIVTALASGFAAVRPCQTIDECRTGKITAGERGGKKLPGLNHGNSPLEMRRCAVAGETLHLTTTNATECLHMASKGASEILVGCLLNATAVARAAQELAQSRGRSITLLACGRNNKEAAEDTIAATEIADALTDCRIFGPLSRQFSTDYVADFLISDTGRNLVELGAGADVSFCAQKDVYSIVPVLRDGVLVEDKATRQAP